MMKKLLISIGTLLIMAFVVVLFVNANGSKKESRKAKTEVKKETAAEPCSTTCNHAALDNKAACDPAKCKEMGSGDKTGKCDPATCTAHKKEAQKESKACCQAAPSAATCGSKAKDIK
jgi:hypothetical protein